MHPFNRHHLRFTFSRCGIFLRCKLSTHGLTNHVRFGNARYHSSSRRAGIQHPASTVSIHATFATQASSHPSVAFRHCSLHAVLSRPQTFVSRPGFIRLVVPTFADLERHSLSAAHVYRLRAAICAVASHPSPGPSATNSEHQSLIHSSQYLVNLPPFIPMSPPPTPFDRPC